MQVEAIYDDGRLELPTGVRLKHSRIRLTVIIPDHEMVAEAKGEVDQLAADTAYGPEHPGETPPQRCSVREAIDEILGPWQPQIPSGPSLPDDDYDRLRYKALEEKYLDRR